MRTLIRHILPIAALTACLLATQPTFAQIKVQTAGATAASVSAIVGGLGVGTAALEATSVTAVRVVHRDTGAAPSATDPVILEIGGTIWLVTAPLTADLTTALDTGTEAAGTNYYVWATADTGAVTLKISASQTAPTGLTTKRLLGSFHNSPTSDILPNSVSSLARGERNHEGMVKVGSQWVDIYEMSVWSSATFGAGTRYGESSDDYACADSGNDCNAHYAQSRAGVIPSRYMSWFQATRFCANAGKHLITDADWQTQALGTPVPAELVVTGITRVGQVATAAIPGHGWGTVGQTKHVIIVWANEAEYNGAFTVTIVDPDTVTYTVTGSPATPATGSEIVAQLQSACVIFADAPYPAGFASACRSWANTYDNVGNLDEWTGTWFASGSIDQAGSEIRWSPTQDYVWNVLGGAWDNAGWQVNTPAAPLRGGTWNYGTYAGVFFLDLDYSPWHVSDSIGGRCAGQ